MIKIKNFLADYFKKYEKINNSHADKYYLELNRYDKYG